jgi:NitT/TauT family transport system substrate-binding protein
VRKRNLRAEVFAFLLFTTVTTARLHAADHVRLALPAKSMGYLPLFIASHRGFFKDESIEIETPIMLPQLAHSALLSGEVDYHGVADSALRLAAKGAPIKTIFFGAARPNYFLMAKPQFKSILELRGKYIGIVRFGDTIELATKIAFNREGMDAQRDALLIMIGLPITRVAALSAGSVDATVVVPPDNVMLRQKGFRELLFLGEVVEFPSNGYATTERQLSEKRELTKRLVRAFYRGLIFARERPDESIQVLEREWRVDSSTAKESYASLAKSFSKDGAASNSGLKVHIDQFQRADKAIGDIPISKIVDFRVLEEVRREMIK